jgi:hypothetical protein
MFVSRLQLQFPYLQLLLQTQLLLSTLIQCTQKVHYALYMKVMNTQQMTINMLLSLHQHYPFLNLPIVPLGIKMLLGEIVCLIPAILWALQVVRFFGFDRNRISWAVSPRATISQEARAGPESFSGLRLLRMRFEL